MNDHVADDALLAKQLRKQLCRHYTYAVKTLRWRMRALENLERRLLRRQAKERGA